MPGTWKSWGMDADGDRKADPKNSVDAIFSSARYLKVNGAPRDYRKALFAYNRAQWYVNKILKTARQFQKFSQKEFDEMAEIAKQYSQTEDRLHSANEQIEELGDKQKTILKNLKQSRKDLKAGQRKLQQAERQAEAQAARLNQATLKYVKITQNLQGGQSGQGTGEQQLLAYMGGARPQDAVLIYISAKAILQRQNLQMQQLRLLANNAAQSQAAMQTQAENQQRSLAEKQASLKQLQVIRNDQQTIIKNARRSMRYKAKVVRSYAQNYLKATGDSGSLQNSPFADLIQGSVLWAGAYRWPVSGPVTSVFGYRCIDFCRQHEGIDIGAQTGVKIRASAPGIVSFAGVMGGYGNLVEVKHRNGDRTRYAHMSRIESRVGQSVNPQSTLGRVGCTGRCFGPHLHFEIIKDGVAKNPLPYLPRR